MARVDAATTTVPGSARAPRTPAWTAVLIPAPESAAGRPAADGGDLGIEVSLRAADRRRRCSRRRHFLTDERPTPHVRRSSWSYACRRPALDSPSPSANTLPPSNDNDDDNNNNSIRLPRSRFRTRILPAACSSAFRSPGTALPPYAFVPGKSENRVRPRARLTTNISKTSRSVRCLEAGRPVAESTMEKPCRYDLSAIKRSLELAETLASVSLMTSPAAKRRLQARSVELGLRPGQPYEPPRELLLYLVR